MFRESRAKFLLSIMRSEKENGGCMGEESRVSTDFFIRWIALKIVRRVQFWRFVKVNSRVRKSIRDTRNLLDMRE